MRFLPLLLFFLLTCNLSAQPYESIFGKNSTLWIIQWENLDFGGIDSIVVEKDTLISGILWKKIISRQPSGWQGGLLREDTISGKVWHRPLDFHSDIEYLAFDFSLVAGDTFDLSTNYHSNINAVVDSTYFTNNTKHIRFDASSVHYNNIEQIIWIEGVTGNQGPIYKASSGFGWPYLLCAFKDGVQTYSNLRHDGNCNPLISGLNSTSVFSGLHVYPNPFQTDLYIECPPHVQFESIEIIDQAGKLLYSQRFENYIETGNLNPGLYFLRLITADGQEVSRVIVRN